MHTYAHLDDVQDLQAAVRERPSKRDAVDHLADVQDLQAAVRKRPSKRDAVDHLAEHYPHCAREFLRRNLAHLLAIDPEQLIKVIGYPDPTGEHATNLAMRRTR